MLTRSRAIDRLRSKTPRSNVEEAVDMDALTTTANPEETAIADERRELIRNALSKLTAQQRRVIELAYFSGLTQSEIAAQLRQPVGTVKSWIRLGMMRLRELLGSLKGI
jgi:RNA polymerase sigma-70 factor (ECF subfamily)